MKTKIILLPKQFEVTFDFQANKWIGGWTSIVHMTTGSNYGWGGRIPGVFALGQKIAVAFAVSGNGNWYFTTPVIPLNKWVHFKVNQQLEGTDYVYRVFMNGKLLKEQVNNKPQEFKEVFVWVSDNWHSAQPGFVKNLVVSSKYHLRFLNMCLSSVKLNRSLINLS